MTKPVPGDVSLPRVSKGKRPHFFEDPSLDQMMTFLLELMAETSALRDRVDTIERLLDAKTSISRDDIESFRADDMIESERTAWRKAFIERVLRMHAPD
ncbi:hypothetical protein [Sphingomonas sp. ERG5]|uniref:hypothetical protein n=1 Tax=Sphingomonas sp. ERG5 TaxID=1381597 RepID=UPI00068BEA99|nr:hypothetical protein [Sphingomonas sp. ERG5]